MEKKTPGIYVGNSLIAYAKVAPWVIADLRAKGLLEGFDKALFGPYFLGIRLPCDPVKRGNKFLRKHNYPDIQPMDPKKDGSLARRGIRQAGWLLTETSE